MMQSQTISFLRDTSMTSAVLRIVNEATIYLAFRRTSAGTKSGQASRACQVRQMVSRSAAVKASSPDSAIIVSSIWRCTSSILYVGCSALSMACKERRRYSLVRLAQSACRPRRAAAAVKARLRPWCQSRMVPPVSKVRALMGRVMRVSLRAHLPRVVRHPLLESRCHLLGEQAHRVDHTVVGNATAIVHLHHHTRDA